MSDHWGDAMHDYFSRSVPDDGPLFSDGPVMPSARTWTCRRCEQSILFGLAHRCEQPEPPQ